MGGCHLCPTLEGYPPAPAERIRVLTVARSSSAASALASARLADSHRHTDQWRGS